jgi:alginate O-acetyltransferase complex protein AlgI
MLFSSTIFLFAFLPLVLTASLLLARSGAGVGARNTLLLAVSLLFYAWGETGYVALLLASIAANHVFGRGIDRARTPQARRGALAVAVAANLLLLGVFKYANFVVDVANAVLVPLGLPALALAPVHLPIGISFFTFQAITYVVDVYRRDAPVEQSPVRLALYISLFPQLIAGPIVRYASIAAELRERSASRDDIAQGIRRFTIGLGKKVLVANTLALPADRIFSLPPGELSAGVAWLGAVCYALQIYFDFSGYSDMAIGLGRIFGFHFPENFLRPYASRSLREFWRRWHVTLSSWFRDYLYVPLGGNRKGRVRTLANLMTTFALCGLWHGASLNFLIWGLLHGTLMIAERVGLGTWLERAPASVARAYVLLTVTLAWVVFRADDLPHAVGYLAALVSPGGDPERIHSLSLFLDSKVALALVAGAIGSAPWLEALRARADTGARPWRALRFAALQGVFVACAMALASGTHNPFIYFRF